MKMRFFNWLYEHHPNIAKRYCPHIWGGLGFGSDINGMRFLCWKCGDFVNGDTITDNQKDYALEYAKQQGWF